MIGLFCKRAVQKRWIEDIASILHEERQEDIDMGWLRLVGYSDD